MKRLNCAVLLLLITAFSHHAQADSQTIPTSNLNGGIWVMVIGPNGQCQLDSKSTILHANSNVCLKGDCTTLDQFNSKSNDAQKYFRFVMRSDF
jgi:hypothetical protein